MMLKKSIVKYLVINILQINMIFFEKKVVKKFAEIKKASTFASQLRNKSS